jgi:hypothetical protein
VPRYAIVIAPALALLAAVAIRALADRRLQVVALVALVALSAVRTGIWYSRVREDWRAAAGYAHEAVARGAVVAVLPGAGRIALHRYAPDLEPVDAPSGRQVVVIVVRGQIDRAPPRVLGREFVGSPRYTLREERRFGRRIVAQRWLRS